jgi:hypothetical protein
MSEGEAEGSFSSQLLVEKQQVGSDVGCRKRRTPPNVKRQTPNVKRQTLNAFRR